ncbi:MAG: hypothetical protein ACI956_001617 [Nonlabens sp.]|jgi:hypothetical protein
MRLGSLWRWMFWWMMFIGSSGFRTSTRARAFTVFSWERAFFFSGPDLLVGVNVGSTPP